MVNNTESRSLVQSDLDHLKRSVQSNIGFNAAKCKVFYIETKNICKMRHAIAESNDSVSRLIINDYNSR